MRFPARTPPRLRFAGPSALALLAGLSAGALGCSKSSAGAGLAPPQGASCTSTIDGGADGTALAAALGSATSGSCVLLSSATYSGSFNVPAGVTLASADGQQATLTGGTNSTPVVSLTGGQGSTLSGVAVTSAAGVGVAVRGGPATISDVTVTGAAVAAFAAICQGSACTTAADLIALNSVTLTSSALGAWISGAYVQMNGGACTGSSSTGLTGGMGVVVTGGGRIELMGTDVESNQGVGVLVDGTGGTTALLQDAVVSNNSDRGVWAQNLTGTMDAPGLSIQGATQVENNHIVGVGGVASQGIIFVGGDVKGTLNAPVETTLGTTESIGDGVGFFQNTGQVKLDGVALSENQRAAGIVDHNIGAIIFVGGDVQAGASNLLFVVQDTSNTADVQVPAADLSTTKPLAVSAPVIPSGSVLQ